MSVAGASEADMPYLPLSNAQQIEQLREGRSGRYEFQFVIGESYETFEALISEAKALAARFDGAWSEQEATQAHPGSFRVILT